MATVTQPPTTALSPIAAAIAEQQRRLVSGDFALLGQIDLIHTASRGTIDFRKCGPLLAAMRDRNDLMIATDVPPLPPLRRVLDAPCPECAGVCGQCEGAKTAPCPRCGGEGKTPAFQQCACVAESGRPAMACDTCRGSGRAPLYFDCGGCKGSGRVACPLCFGTGEEGRGCEACEGQGRKIEQLPQPVEQFVHGRLEGRIAVGPIRAIVFHTLDGSGRIDIVDFRPDRQGNLAVLFLEFSADDPSAAAKGYLIGGLPMLRPRRGAR